MWTSSLLLHVAILASQVVPVLSHLEVLFFSVHSAKKRSGCPSMAGPCVSFSVDGVRTSVRCLVGAGEEPVFAFYLDNQIHGKLTVFGVNSAHYTGDLVYTNVVSTSY